jgi:hypothetical protein
LPWFNRDVPSDYHFRPSLVLRLAGGCLAILGVVLLVASVATIALDGPLTVVMTVTLAGAVVVLGAAVVVTRLAPVLRLDAEGYRVRLIRHTGVSRSRWRDVEDVVTATLRGHDCVVVRLRDGGSTTVPLAVIGADRGALLADLHDHLDRAHGYRRLR